MLRARLATLALISSVLAAAACSANSADTNQVNGQGGSGTGGLASGGTGAVINVGGNGDGGTEKETIVVIGPGASDDAPGKFGGEPVAAAPEWAYPESGVIVPPNMNSIELHFVPGPGQTLFEITFHAEKLDLIVYLGCNPVGQGCVYSPDQTFWERLADGSRGAAPVTYAMRGVDGGNPGTVGTSETREISFSLEDIVGGLYYWNDAGVIQRYDFGYALATAELYLTPQQAGAGVCVGCHAVSPDGRKIVVGKDIPAPAPYTEFDIATKVAVQGTNGPVSGAGNFFSFSPDGGQLLYSNGRSIGWRDANSGVDVNSQVVANGTMPDWSPDGSALVYSASSSPPPVAVPGITGGSLYVAPFSSGQFGAGTPLVQSQGENNYYPAWSPDSQWVLYNRSASNTDSFSNTVDGELWVVPKSGGSPTRLSAVSDPGWSSWPKWAPGVHTSNAHPVMYFTFSSNRAYGVRLASGATTQLWMAAFDPTKVGSGDPAAPAFRLPFQDITTGNHIAQWVAKIVRKPCQDDGACESNEKCKDGICVPEQVK